MGQGQAFPARSQALGGDSSANAGPAFSQWPVSLPEREKVEAVLRASGAANFGGLTLAGQDLPPPSARSALDARMREAGGLRDRLGGKSAPSARGGKPNRAHSGPRAERTEGVRMATPASFETSSPPPSALRPMVPVSTVALRLHKAVRMMEEFPAAACDEAWLRVHGALSAFRSEMLWLNENFHLAPPAEGIEVDVSEALDRLRVKKKRAPKTSHNPQGGSLAVCHVKWFAGN